MSLTEPRPGNSSARSSPRTRPGALTLSGPSSSPRAAGPRPRWTTRTLQSAILIRSRSRYVSSTQRAFATASTEDNECPIRQLKGAQNHSPERIVSEHGTERSVPPPVAHPGARNRRYLDRVSRRAVYRTGGPQPAAGTLPLDVTDRREVATPGGRPPLTLSVRYSSPRDHCRTAPRGRAPARGKRALWDGVSFVRTRREPSLWRLVLFGGVEVGSERSFARSRGVGSRCGVVVRAAGAAMS